MIDGNLTWRGTYPLTENGAMPQVAKSGDSGNAVSGSALGDAFEAHILEMEGAGQKTTAALPQNGRQRVLQQSLFAGRGNSEQQGSGRVADSSSAPTPKFGSPSDGDMSSSLFSKIYGNIGRNPTDEAALRVRAQDPSDPSETATSPVDTISGTVQSDEITDAETKAESVIESEAMTRGGVGSNEGSKSFELSSAVGAMKSPQDGATAPAAQDGDTAESSSMALNLPETTQAIAPSPPAPADVMTDPEEHNAATDSSDDTSLSNFSGKFHLTADKSSGLHSRPAKGRIDPASLVAARALPPGAKTESSGSNAENALSPQTVPAQIIANPAVPASDRVAPTESPRDRSTDSSTIPTTADDSGQTFAQSRTWVGSSRYRATHSREERSAPPANQTVSADSVAALAAQNQNSAIGLSVTDPSTDTAAKAEEGPRGGIIANDDAAKIGATATSATMSKQSSDTLLGGSSANDFVATLAERNQDSTATLSVMAPSLATAANAQEDPRHGSVQSDEASADSAATLSVMAPSLATAANAQEDPRHGSVQSDEASADSAATLSVMAPSLAIAANAQEDPRHGSVQSNEASVDSASTSASRNQVLRSREDGNISPADSAATLAAPSQESAAMLSVTAPSLAAAANAQEDPRHGSVQSDEASTDSATASAVASTPGLTRKNDDLRDLSARPRDAGEDDPAHAAQANGKRSIDSLDATAPALMAASATPQTADPSLDAVVDSGVGAVDSIKPEAGSNRRGGDGPAPSGIGSFSADNSGQTAVSPAQETRLGNIHVQKPTSLESAPRADTTLTTDTESETSNAAIAPSVALSVVGQSRNLAPPVVASLVQQVTNPILTAAQTIGRETGKNLPAVEAVKTLEIRLVPENLGTVLVKMRLAGDALEVQVEADRQGTLRLLTDNKDTLSQSIQSSGYKLDSMTLQAGSGGSGLDGGQASQEQASQGQASQGQGHRFEFQSSPQGSGSSPGSSPQGENRMRDQSHLGKDREGRSGETSDGYAQENDRDRRSDTIYV